MHKSVTRALLGLFLLLVTVLAVGCDRLPFNLPSFGPTATPELMLTPVSDSTASVLPEGPYSPVVVDHTPKTGQMVLPTTDIVVRFDQPMDRASVENALHIYPEVEGDLIWQDDSTILLRPGALTSETRYRISVGPEAESLDGLTLASGLSFAFSTAPPITVTRVNPSDGSADMRVDAPVLVSFNQPVVSSDCAGQVAKADCPVLPLSFSPAVLGDGMWVNTSLYRFVPFNGWAAGITYTVALEDDFKSVGGSLVEPYAWDFVTAPPSILDVSPRADQTDVPLDKAVSVVFNTPMDEEITAGVFSLRTADGVAVPGVVTWQDDGAVLVFTPTLPLTLSTRYNVRVGERSRAVSSAPLNNPQTWSFVTIGAPSIVDFVPEDGARGISLSEPVNITLGGLLDSQTLPAHVRIDPEPTGLYQYFDAATRSYYLSWERQPQTRYCVTLTPGIADVYGNVLAEEFVSCFTTGDLEPFAGPAVSFDAATLDAAEEPLFYFAVRNQSSLALTLYSLSEADFIDGGRHSEGTELRDWSERLNVGNNQTDVVAVSLTRRGDPLEPGYYRLEWDSRWGREGMDLAVVNYHVTVKLAKEEALAWVTDLHSGVPISRTAVRLVDQEGLLIAAGTTDANGLARIPISPRDNLWQNTAAIVGEPGVPGFGVAMINWQGDVTPRAFDITLNNGPFSPFDAFVYTDRPIYRPGQQVFFRGVVREEREDGYVLPGADTPLSLTLLDPNSEAVFSDTLTLSELGSFDGAIRLPSTAVSGRYRLALAVGDGVVLPGWHTDFDVAAYRKPEFEITVTPEFTRVLQGETIRAVLQAEYFFGEPVSDAPFSWVVRAEPAGVGLSSSGDGWDAVPEFSVETSRVIASGEGRTDDAGQFLLELPAELQPLEDQDGVEAQRWTLDVTVVDESGFSVNGRGNVLVHPARIYLNVLLDRRVLQPDDEVSVNVRSFDWDLFPDADRDVTLALVWRNWYQVPGEVPLPGFEWVYSDTLVSTLDVTTDAGGLTTAEFTPGEGGAYVVVAEATDEDGTPVRAEASLWVSGVGDVPWQMPSSLLTPVADAREYEVGDTASILLPTSFDGPYQVLMTVERGGVLDVQHFSFDAPNPVVSLPIRDVYAPNVYVSFVLIQGIDEAHPVPEARSGYVALSVVPTEQLLTLELVPNKLQYEPGEVVSLSVRTLDAAGDPVDAEVGLSLVDKAVLVLSDVESPSIVRAFYGRHLLGVVSGDSSLVLLNRLSQQVGELTVDTFSWADVRSLGGAAAIGDEAAATELRLQEAFPETSLWEAHVRTGDAGETQVTVALPDLSTTWVLEAQAATLDTLVGEKRIELRASRPLSLRPLAPNFFVVGDRAQVAAIVHNNTDEDVTVTITLDAGLVPVEESEERTVTIVAGGRVRVAWILVVPQSGVQAVPLSFLIEGDSYRDVVRFAPGENGEGTPVYRYEMPDAVGISGVLPEEGRRVATLLIPSATGDASTLDMRVDADLASVLLDGLDYLERDTYDTNDALVARFLPALAMYQTLQASGVEDEILAARSQVAFSDSQGRLYMRQNADGGWGWWSSRESTIHLTAYVAVGLIRARDAGFDVREDVLEQALSYLYSALQSDLQSGSRYSRDALALYALSEGGRSWPSGAGSALYAVRDSLGPTGRAYLALAFGIVDPSDTRLATLFESLSGDAEVTASGFHWEVDEVGFGETNVQATAVVLGAFARFSPNELLLSQTVRWLMAERLADHWGTPYETAWVLVALADYRVTTDGSETPDYTWGLALNGTVLRSSSRGIADSTTPWQLQLSLQSETPSLHRDSPNVFEISRTAGIGRLYYAARLSRVTPVEQLVAESRGLGVRREYCAVGKAAEDVALCAPVQQVRVGDLVEVRLTFVVPQMRTFVLLSDPYPAGFVPVEPVLGSGTLASGSGVSGPAKLSDFAVWWQDPFDRRDLYDDHAAFLATDLTAGTYQVSYLLRASFPGAYYALPAMIREMYFPEVWGRGNGALLYVLPSEP